MRKLLKILFKVLLIAGGIYAALFAVFFFDLDGKFMFYVWEPMMVKRFDKMQRKDATKTPYEQKADIEG